MDRFSYLPMGRRRPWVIGAQLGLLGALTAMASVPDPLSRLTLITAIGFLVNSFAAIQDVAVDGMAIDVLPEDERGRANAFMAFGQVAGYSGSAAASAALLSASGLGAAATALAAGVAAIVLLATVVRERPGERTMPWTAGSASERSLDLQAGSWQTIFANLLRVMFLPTSLTLMAVVLFYRLCSGMTNAASPIIAVQHLGWSDVDYSSWTAWASAAAALFGLAIGPLIDRIGSRRVLLYTLPLTAVIYLVTSLMRDYWDIWYVPLTVLFVSSFASQVLFISIIAIHMNICWLRVSATQFAIYMAWANLASSFGAWFYGRVASHISFGDEFLTMAVSMAIAAALIHLVDLDAHRARLDALGEHHPD